MPLLHLTSNFKVFATVRGRGAYGRNQCPDSMPPPPPPARAVIYNHEYTHYHLYMIARPGQQIWMSLKLVYI